MEDVLSQLLECEEMGEIRGKLEELVVVLQDESSTNETLQADYERTNREKQYLLNSVNKLKTELEEERNKRKEEEKKVAELQKSLKKEYDKIDLIKKEYEKTKEEINTVKKKLNTCEMEKYDIMINVEKIKVEMEWEWGKKKDMDMIIETPLAGTQYYEREMSRSRRIIDYGAKSISFLKRKLDDSVNELKELKLESETNKEELARYKTNYWDRSINYDRVMLDLLNLERLLSFRRNAVECNIVRRIKEVLSVSICESLHKR